MLTEGHVSAGDEIVRTARGPHAAERRRRRRAALPARARPGAAAGRLGHPGPEPGLARVVPEHAGGRAAAQPAGIALAPPPAWAGFRTLTVTEVVAESDSVTSFRLAADDALPAYLPGQFLTLRVPGAGDPVPVRTYSLSGDPDGGRYRISVKREAHGLVSPTSTRTCVPATGSRWRPRAVTSCSTRGRGPVLLISAGIGLTPVLAMLHRLASETSPARCGGSTPPTTRHSHAFSAEAADLLGRLAVGALPGLLHGSDQPPAPDSGVRAGRLTAEVIAGLGLPTDATAYVCGPESFMDDVTAALAGVGIDPAEHPHRAVRLAIARSTPASSRRTRRRRTSRPARRGPARR